MNQRPALLVVEGGDKTSAFLRPFLELSSSEAAQVTSMSSACGRIFGVRGLRKLEGLLRQSGKLFSTDPVSLKPFFPPLATRARHSGPPRPLPTPRPSTLPLRAVPQLPPVLQSLPKLEKMVNPLNFRSRSDRCAPAFVTPLPIRIDSTEPKELPLRLPKVVLTSDPCLALTAGPQKVPKTPLPDLSPLPTFIPQQAVSPPKVLKDKFAVFSISRSKEALRARLAEFRTGARAPTPQHNLSDFRDQQGFRGPTQNRDSKDQMARREHRDFRNLIDEQEIRKIIQQKDPRHQKSPKDLIEERHQYTPRQQRSFRELSNIRDNSHLRDPSLLKEIREKSYQRIPMDLRERINPMVSRDSKIFKDSRHRKESRSSINQSDFEDSRHQLDQTNFTTPNGQQNPINFRKRIDSVAPSQQIDGRGSVDRSDVGWTERGEEITPLAHNASLLRSPETGGGRNRSELERRLSHWKSGRLDVAQTPSRRNRTAQGRTGRVSGCALIPGETSLVFRLRNGNLRADETMLGSASLLAPDGTAMLVASSSTGLQRVLSFFLRNSASSALVVFLCEDFKTRLQKLNELLILARFAASFLARRPHSPPLRIGFQSELDFSLSLDFDPVHPPDLPDPPLDPAVLRKAFLMWTAWKNPGLLRAEWNPSQLAQLTYGKFFHRLFDL